MSVAAPPSVESASAVRGPDGRNTAASTEWRKRGEARMLSVTTSLSNTTKARWQKDQLNRLRSQISPQRNSMSGKNPGRVWLAGAIHVNGSGNVLRISEICVTPTSLPRNSTSSSGVTRPLRCLSADFALWINTTHIAFRRNDTAQKYDYTSTIQLRSPMLPHHVCHTKCFSLLLNNAALYICICKR